MHIETTKEVSMKEASTKETPTKEAPSNEAPPNEAPPNEAPPNEAPPNEAPSKEAPSKEALKKKAPTKDSQMKDVPTIKAATKDKTVAKKPEPTVRSTRSRQVAVIDKTNTSSKEPVQIKKQPTEVTTIDITAETETPENVEKPVDKSVEVVEPQDANPPIKEPRIVKFEHDEIVWARVRGFPSHPAKIVDPTKRKKIPENVLKLKGKQADTVLVEFFEVNEIHLWGWIERKEIHPFGDTSTDVEMLQQAKKTKKSYRIKEVKNGYKFACKLKNIDPLPQLQSVFKR
ncbi:unnamed protein product [Mucor hiemalis]